jgi:murein DD-endopeptidase MepM/ murein hydrolase activator NlpD
VKRQRAVSALWTMALLVVATVALVGITRFMMRIHRGDGWVPSEPSASPSAPPAVLRDGGRTVPRTAPPSSSTDTIAAARATAPEGRPLTTDTAVATLRARALTLPVQGIEPGALVPSFSEARGARVHEALDIMAPTGTPVVAVDDGRVARLFRSDAGGLTVYQFDPSQRVAYYYAHLRDYAAGLAEGQAVTRGQVIGYVGSTGNADPDAPHLHFAIFVLGPERRWWEGMPIDPYAVLK